MAKRNRISLDILSAKDALLTLIEEFGGIPKENMRERVLALIPVHELLQDIGAHIIDPDLTASGRERILKYFLAYPYTILSTKEIMIVSGILDYPRRIRELRVQFGWNIYSGSTIKEMRLAGDWDNSIADVDEIQPDDYVLMNDSADRDAAYRWRISNALRKEKIGTQDKLLAYFQHNVGKPVTGEELAYIANGKTEWNRRTRELRTEEGWPIKTKMSGRPDLPTGVYILEENKQAEPHDRHISDSVRVEVLNRDHFACRRCNWTQEQATESDPRRFLELHHLEHHAAGGSNEEDNLVTLCNVHHDEVHKRKMSAEAVLQWICPLPLA